MENCYCQGRSHYWDRATPHTQAYTHPSTQSLQDDVKSLVDRKQVDGSTVCYVHPGDIEIIYYYLRALSNVEISYMRFHRPGRDSNTDHCTEKHTG